MAKAKKTELTDTELVVLAACFARTNIGMPVPDRARVQRLLELKMVSLGGCVSAMCGQYMESDDDHAMFMGEAKMWRVTLKKDGREKITKVWPHMAALIWA